MRAAIFQMTSGIDPAANAAAIVEMVARAKGEGADMLFTPEMAGYLDRDRQRAAATLRSEADDPVLAAVREAAAKQGLWVHLGSLPLKDERADGRWANRSFMIDGSGEGAQSVPIAAAEGVCSVPRLFRKPAEAHGPG